MKKCEFTGETKKDRNTVLKERNITVKLSDADCDSLVRKCGECGLTVGELLENFIGDLIDGTCSNGSDERDLADQWFERCWFGMYTEQTLLNHLLDFGYDPEDYLRTLDNIESAMESIRETEKEIAYPTDKWKHLYRDSAYTRPCYSNVDEYVTDLKKELPSYQACFEVWSKELEDMREYWEPEEEPNMDEELDLIKKWVQEREKLLCTS